MERSLTLKSGPLVVPRDGDAGSFRKLDQFSNGSVMRLSRAGILQNRDGFGPCVWGLGVQPPMMSLGNMVG